jgi:hypothetical protein
LGVGGHESLAVVALILADEHFNMRSTGSVRFDLSRHQMKKAARLAPGGFSSGELTNYLNL